MPFFTTYAECLIPLAALCMASLAAPAQAWTPPDDYYAEEYAVKTVMLEKFTLFVEWPEETFGPSDGRFVVGVAGDNPIYRYLKAFYKNRKIKDREVTVLRVENDEDLLLCHVLVVSASERDRVDDILAVVATKPILTIGDMENYAEHGLIFSFIEKGGRLRFQVNMDAVFRGGLRISSRLLKLGIVVKGEGAGNDL